MTWYAHKNQSFEVLSAPLWLKGMLKKNLLILIGLYATGSHLSMLGLVQTKTSS